MQKTKDRVKILSTISVDELAALQRIAAKTGHVVSSWVRWMIQRAIAEERERKAGK